jgi:hypothetical protein
MLLGNHKAQQGALFDCSMTAVRQTAKIVDVFKVERSQQVRSDLVSTQVR